jgi:hypothetical protein
VGLVALIVATAVMYLWNITINGMGNQFYAAAAQAGSTNWEALLFGSLDPHNFITVDKPPVSQWVMGLSGQIFGFNSASMLIPQALMAVAAVALLYGAVARISGPRTGLLAGTVLALTPVAALMFPVQQPRRGDGAADDGAVYCAVRARRHASEVDRPCRVALGFAFLTKLLEGIMVMPAIGSRLSGRGADLDRQEGAAPCGRTRDVPGLGGLVRGADPGGWRVAALHRRLDGQQLRTWSLVTTGSLASLARTTAFAPNPVVGASAGTQVEVHGHTSGFRWLRCQPQA